MNKKQFYDIIDELNELSRQIGYLDGLMTAIANLFGIEFLLVFFLLLEIQINPLLLLIIDTFLILFYNLYILNKNMKKLSKLKKKVNRTK